MFPPHPVRDSAALLVYTKKRRRHHLSALRASRPVSGAPRAPCSPGGRTPARGVVSGTRSCPSAAGKSSTPSESRCHSSVYQPHVPPRPFFLFVFLSFESCWVSLHVSAPTAVILEAWWCLCNRGVMGTFTLPFQGFPTILIFEFEH